MTAEIISLPVRADPPNPGNGAREALINIEPMPTDGTLGWADWILVGLWIRGFKVVPLDGTEIDA